MSKRKFEDDSRDEWDITEPKIKAAATNSLDSDEEDEVEEKTYDILAEDDIEGQEDGTAGFDGEVRITPFNMKEELEEGHFDTEGNYHWNKEGNIRDNWLENIDWVKVKPKDKKEAEGDDDDKESNSDDSSTSSPFDQVAVYKQMLELMKPGETVAKSLRRLGGNKTMSASERWRRKKEGLDDSSDINKQQVTELTELANRILNKTGNMDIYQENYEYISNLIEKSNSKKSSIKVRTGADVEDVLDMYADDFDEKEKARMEQREEKKKEEDTTESSDRNTEVMWEFKWEEGSADIHGPHSSSQMQAWVEQGYFKKPVIVRKCGTEGQFYSSSRVDFDLYV